MPISKIPSYELPASNTTHAYLFFSYEPIEQKHNIVIVPEFSAITLATFSLFIAIAVSLRRELRKFSSLGGFELPSASQSSADFKHPKEGCKILT